MSSNKTGATTSRIPAHVFAPYFEGYNGDSLSGLSSQSGDKFLTIAFAQATSAGSCTSDWNGDTAIGSAYASDIAESCLRLVGLGEREVTRARGAARKLLAAAAIPR